MTPWIRVSSLLGVCVSMIICAGCATPPPQASPKPDDQPSAADRRQSEAFAHFTQAQLLEADPNKTDRAIDQYLLAAKADPTRQLLYTSAARAAIGDMDIPHAIEILQQDVATNPTLAEAHMELGAVYQLHGDQEEAIAEYKKAMALAPTNLPPYLYLADLHFGEDRDADALIVLGQGIKHIPSSKAMLSAYVYRAARQMLDAGQYTRAIPCLQFVADSMDEGNGLVHELIGKLYEAQNDTTNANVHFRLAANATPPAPDAVVKVALSNLPDNPDKAISIVEKALGRSEDDDELLFALALIYRETKHMPECLATFEALKTNHAATNAPLTERFYMNYADTCVTAGFTNKAEEILFECITVHPESDQAMNFLAYTWAEQGVKLDKALSYVKQALAERPKNGAYLDTLGWIYFKQGLFDKAMETLIQANAMMEDPVITDHLGDAYLATGKADKAIEHWKRSLFLDPTADAVRAKLTARGITIDTEAPPANSKPKPSAP